MVKIKSIKVRTLLSVLPVTIALLIVLVISSYYVSKNMLSKQIDSKIKNNANELKVSVDSKLQSHAMVAKTLAKAVETNGSNMSQDDYKNLLSKYILLNHDTMGAGVWYEPSKYKSDIKYFGPYVYKQGNKTEYTDEYMSEDYAYPNQDWYKNGKNSNGEVSWTTPYYDKSTNMTMLTTTVPFYDGNNNFMGETTADINLNDLQSIMNGLKIGQSGKAFLLTKDGYYIAGVDKSDIMKKNVKNDSKFSGISKSLLSGKSGNGYYYDGNDKRVIYYIPIGETNWVLAITMSQSEIYAPLRSLLTTLIILGLIMLALISAAIIVYSNYITKSVSEVNKLSATISGGDLTQSIDVKSEDELGQMTENLNVMSQNLRNVFKSFLNSLDNIVGTSEELTASAGQTESAAGQVADSMQDISDQVNSQADNTKQISSEVEEINRSIKNIKDNMSETSSLSASASTSAKNGDQIIKNAIEQIKEITTSVNETTGIVNELDDKSKKINDIISIINDIAEQTNLLALNASIEAARAGEAGKGFAVVADEVAKLANESSKSAEEIGKLIHEIQVKITNTVEFMGKETAAVKKGNELVENAGKSFYEIVNSVNDVSSKISEMVNEVDAIYGNSNGMTDNVMNISSSANKTSDHIQNVAAASEEQSALMKQISEAAEGLTKIVVELQEHISKYKI